MAMAVVQARGVHGAVAASVSSSMHSSGYSSSSSCCVFLSPFSSFRNLSPSVSALLRSQGLSITSRIGSRRRQSGAGILKCTAQYAALTPEMKEALDAFIAANKVVLFMKGNKSFPQCGFSNTCVQILNQFNVPYETVNILEDDSLRQGVKEYSNWPTFPQLYIDGEFYGGCDITIEAFKSGELKETLDRSMLS